MNEYFYQANLVNPGQWMIKRSESGDFTTDTVYKECLISVDTTDKEIAIKTAIDRDSWA